MIRTNHPLEEKMTLFWHNHFATAISKVKSVYLMYNQNQFLRSNALGNFKDILMGITIDPAMQIWLDLAGSNKANPNENYAREVMEVFSTGRGPYTQTDVTEGAKAFSGYIMNRTTGAVTFDAARHDNTVKTFLGNMGNFGPEDIINILVARPETAANLSTELFSYFAYANPSAETVSNLSSIYFRNGYSIKAIVEAILTSPEFLSANAYLGKVKSPVEFVATAARSLGATVNLWQKPSKFGEEEQTMNDMGQIGCLAFDTQKGNTTSLEAALGARNLHGRGCFPHFAQSCFTWNEITSFYSDMGGAQSYLDVRRYPQSNPWLHILVVRALLA